MKKLATFLLLHIFVLTGSNYSIHMFSLEQGSVYIENFNIFHVFNNLPTDVFTTSEKHKNSLTCRKDKHAHVILINSITKKKSDIIIGPINLIPIDFTLSSRPDLHSLTPANTSQNNSILKFLSSIPTPSLLKTTVLLV